MCEHDADRLFRCVGGKIAFEPFELLGIDVAVIRFAAALDVVEHDEVPAAGIEAVIGFFQLEAVEREGFAEAGLIVPVVFRAPAPDVMVAEDRVALEFRIVGEDFLIDVPLRVGALAGGFEGIHHVIAADDEEFGGGIDVGERLERLGVAGGRAVLGLDVHVGQVGEAQRRPLWFGGGQRVGDEDSTNGSE